MVVAGVVVAYFFENVSCAVGAGVQVVFLVEVVGGGGGELVSSGENLFGVVVVMVGEFAGLVLAWLVVVMAVGVGAAS